MSLTAAPPAPRRLLLLPLLGVALAALAVGIAHAPVRVPLLLTVAAVMFLATLLNADAGLVILVVSMLFSPEVPLGGAGGAGLEGSRAVTLRTDDLALLLVGFAWVARMAIHKDLGAIRRTRLNLFIAAYTAACLVSTLVGIEVGRVRPLVGLCFVAKYVEYFVVFFMTVNYVRSETPFRRLLAAVLITAALIGLYAAFQIPSGVRPSAPFEGKEGEPNTLGGYLVLLFSVATAIALSGAGRGWRRGSGLLAIGCLPPLLATLSRSSWLALAASLATLLVLSPERRRLAVVVVVALALLLVAHPRALEERILYTFHGEANAGLSVGHVRLDPSASARLTSWSSALKGFAAHPILGWGVTGYGFLDAQYFRVLVELGIAGFATFGLLLVSLGRLLVRCRAVLREPLHRALALGLTAGYAGLLVHAVGTNTFLLIRIMEPFWLLTGLAVAALHLEEVG
jgi:O-antigen ligase